MRIRSSLFPSATWHAPDVLGRASDALQRRRQNQILRLQIHSFSLSVQSSFAFDTGAGRQRATEVHTKPHWEGDLLSGSKNSYIATLVERHTRYVMLAKVANKDTQTVVSALIKQAKKLPSELYRSLTWDRGKELTDHRRFTLTTNIDVYFCDPQSPWQRGSNENTNGLLRQYFRRAPTYRCTRKPI